MIKHLILGLAYMAVPSKVGFEAGHMEFLEKSNYKNLSTHVSQEIVQIEPFNKFEITNILSGLSLQM